MDLSKLDTRLPGVDALVSLAGSSSVEATPSLCASSVGERHHVVK